MRSLHVAMAIAVATSLALVPRDAVAVWTRTVWQEHFDHPLTGWSDPISHSAAELARVYSVRNEGASSYLHARHDFTGASPPPALH
jgi:hypothetical protein